MDSRSLASAARPAARFLPYRAGDGRWNMAVDEALLEHATQPTLRFYGWDAPTISFGATQARRQDLRALEGAGLAMVRRLTGGGAIVHATELTYSIVLSADDPLVSSPRVAESYARLHAPIQRALTELGVVTQAGTAGPDRSGSRALAPVLCFARATDLDLAVNGIKLVGSAQRRRSGRVLQHGSILIESHPLQPGTTSLADELARVPALPELCAHFARHFESVLGPLQTGTLSAAESEHATAAAPGFKHSPVE